MATSPQKCPKCSGSLEQGFVVDHSYGSGARVVSEWAPGAPLKSFWTGTKLPEDRVPIGTYRCAKCGYLEMYARQEFGAK